MGANQVERERERKKHGGNLILVLFSFLFFFVLCFFLLISSEFDMVIVCFNLLLAISSDPSTWSNMVCAKSRNLLLFPLEYIYTYTPSIR